MYKFDVFEQVLPYNLYSVKLVTFREVHARYHFSFFVDKNTHLDIYYKRTCVSISNKHMTKFLETTKLDHTEHIFPEYL